jgi:ankyrin repeat protein
MLRLLLPYAGNEINCPDSNGFFPIHLCIQNGFSQGIVLIDELCPLFNPNLSTDQADHPLHFVLQNKRFEHPCTPPLLQSLLSLKRLDLNVPNVAGLTPLLLILTDDLFARVENTLAMIVDLLASDPRCDLNAPGLDGVTPLYIAIVKNKVAIAKILISHGAFPNQPTTDGKTPLFAAISGGGKPNLDLLILLLSSGANPDQWPVNRKLPSQWDGLTPEIRNELQKWAQNKAPAK